MLEILILFNGNRYLIKLISNRIKIALLLLSKNPALTEEIQIFTC